MAGEVAQGLTTGEWISACGLAVVIVLQLLKWSSDKGEAKAMRQAMREQMEEIKAQISKLWERSDQHTSDIAFFRGKFTNNHDGRASRVLAEDHQE